MKTNYLFITLLSIGLIQLSACGQTSEDLIIEESGIEAGNESQIESITWASRIDEFPKSELSENEISGLIFMREEEKLARDVYLTLYSQWSLMPFKNISKSEQVHMDAILYLLNRYEIDDPAEGNEIGEFKNEELQKLYDQLIEQGVESAVEALKVGALIEEVDIVDIQRMLDNDFESEDIVFVMNNLKRGSGNHLRAFVRNLKRYNIDYTPELLDIDIYNEILN